MLRPARDVHATFAAVILLSHRNVEGQAQLRRQESYPKLPDAANTMCSWMSGGDTIGADAAYSIATSCLSIHAFPLSSGIRARPLFRVCNSWLDASAESLAHRHVSV